MHISVTGRFKSDRIEKKIVRFIEDMRNFVDFPITTGTIINNFLCFN